MQNEADASQKRTNSLACSQAIDKKQSSLESGAFTVKPKYIRQNAETNLLYFQIQPKIENMGIFF